jgi:phosphatidylserine decarboxylase
LGLTGAAAWFWRTVWFFRNPDRAIPAGSNVVSPADGRVVYVERLSPGQPVMSAKKGRAFCVTDIVREDLDGDKVLIGVFMSPFDVHYNRAPLAGRVASIRHHPPMFHNHHMTAMHWRCIARRFPFYAGSRHMVENERTVTRINGEFKGEPVSCYVVQIAGGSVRGIQSFVEPGAPIQKGERFGMIRIGSQVDVVMTGMPEMKLRVRPGQRVFAGESILIE